MPTGIAKLFARGGLALGVVIAICGGGNAAWSQNGPGDIEQAATGAANDTVEGDLIAVTTPYDEEVVVRGGRSIWRQLERAEDAFFDRFNAINSSDDFDIVCLMRAPLGSTIKRRECRANFWRDEDANAARDSIFRLQGGYAGNEALAWHAQQVSSDRMLEEMVALSRADPELAEALAELVRVRRRLDGAPMSSSTREVLPPDGVAMPFDASRIFRARVGRKAWTHQLTTSTFTFAEVDGDIYEMQAACGGQIKPLRYAADMEWTLPGSWGACELVVEASRGTSFYLLEFDSQDLP